ncbi:MAG: bile acid:sodium symporter [Thermoplasmata archaeon]
MNKEKIIKKLSLKTLLFPIFVVIAMIFGLFLGFKFKAESVYAATYGIPIGLFFMIYPAMSKVILKDFFKSLKDLKSISLMLFLNYLIDPFLVAGLGYFFFYFIFYQLGLISFEVAKQAVVGVILLGVAPCIAMVIVWNDLSKGNVAMAVSFVAWNSIIQIITTPLLVFVLARTTVIIDPFLILESVLLYLALPLISGIITRKMLSGKTYFSKILNLLSNVQILALLFTILVMFWSEGYGILEYPSLIWMMAIVMLTFYFLLFHIGYYLSRKLGYNYSDSTAIGYTVAARDFEISIAIAIVAFVNYAFVPIITAIGPLLEIPLMLLLVLIQVNYPALTDGDSTSSVTLGLLASTAMLAFTCGIRLMYSSMLLVEA